MEPASSRASNPLSKILAVLIIIAAMVGCFIVYHFWKDRPLATTLEGEVFIVTKGGQNYKLGLVTVGIERADTLKQYLDEEKRDPTVAEKRKAYKVAQAIANNALDAWRKSEYKDLAAYEELTKAEKRASAALDTYEHFLVNTVLAMMPRSTEAKTDADGHFTMPIPGPGPFLLRAEAERAVGDTVEHYYWFFLLPPPDRGKIKVTLSNDNLTSPAKIVDFVFKAVSSGP